MTARRAPDEALARAALTTYARDLPPPIAAVCRRLRARIDAALPRATARLYHGAPVWFIGENAVVGYRADDEAVTLLFWNGQAFAEPDLVPVGSFHAAQARFSSAGAIDERALRRWLAKARRDIWDFAALRRRHPPGGAPAGAAAARAGRRPPRA